MTNLPVCNQLKNIIKVGAYSMIATNTKNTADMLVKHSQNAPLEDYAPNTVDLLTQWKAQLSGLFKLPFAFFNFGK